MVDLENKNLNREGFTMMKRWLENRNAGKTFADFSSVWLSFYSNL